MSFKLVYNPDLDKALHDLDTPCSMAATLLLSQMDFWLSETESGHYTTDGRKWIYNSYEAWTKKQLPTLNKHQIGRIFRHLRDKLHLIETTNFAGIKSQLSEQSPESWNPWNQSTWVTLNFKKIFELTGWVSRGLQKEREQEEELNTSANGNVHLCNIENSQQNDGNCNSEASSIYKENHISHHKREAGLEKEKSKSINEKGGVFDPSLSNKESRQDNSIPGKIVKQDTYRRNSTIPNNGNTREISQESREKYAWEIAVGKPYPVFLNWRAEKHYKPQGDKWASDARGNAYSEFYRNRGKVNEVLFPEFMAEVRSITEKVQQGQFNKVEAAKVLPSWFIETLPEATEENVTQLMNNLKSLVAQGDVQVALPNKAATPSSQTVAYEQIQNQKEVKALPSLEARAILAPGATNDEQQKREETLVRKKVAWNNPHLKARVREWVEITPWVIITEHDELAGVWELEKQTITDTDSAETSKSVEPEATDDCQSSQLADPWEEDLFLLEPELPQEAETVLEQENEEIKLEQKAGLGFQKSSTTAEEKCSTVSEHSKMLESNISDCSAPVKPSGGLSKCSDILEGLTNLEIVKDSNNSTESEIMLEQECSNTVEQSPKDDIADSANQNSSDTLESSKTVEDDISDNSQKASVAVQDCELSPLETSDTTEASLEENQKCSSTLEHSDADEQLKILYEQIQQVWCEQSKLGRLILDTPQAHLEQLAKEYFNQEDISRIKEAATAMWACKANSYAEYEGKRVKVVKRLKGSQLLIVSEGKSMKVPRKTLTPWLGL